MSNNPLQFAAIGECMLELRHQDSHHLILGFAGDTYNALVYFTRSCINYPLTSHYITAVGDDPYSDMMLAAFQQEKINTTLVQRLAKQLPGLYFIQTDVQGERRFYYYRQQAAARQLFNEEISKQLSQSLCEFDYLFLSGISLAILDPANRQRLYENLSFAKQHGARICFDTNYRARLWPDIATAQQAMKTIAPLVDIVLPTFDDEQQLFGDPTPEDTIKRWQQWQVSEIVLKLGANGCVISDNKKVEYISAEKIKKVVDTTAAGDSFAGGYLAKRIQGIEPIAAACFAQRLAATVIQYPGAIIPLEAMVYN